MSLGLAKTDFLVIALGLIVLLVLESLQERGVQIRAGLEKKSGFVQWAAMTALPFLGVTYAKTMDGAAAGGVPARRVPGRVYPVGLYLYAVLRRCSYEF